ncbi:MAG: M4 family metallopeptidase [bacterium]
MTRLLPSLFIAIAVFTTASAEVDEDGFGRFNTLILSPVISTYQADERGIPEYVEGNLSQPVAAGEEVAAALSFFADNKAAYRMADPAEELLLVRLDSDELGMRHVRFQQHFRGLPVIGSELIAHFSAEGVLHTVGGRYLPEIALETTPAVTAETATALAETDLQSFFGPARPDEPQLVVFPWNEQYYLCWRLFLYSDTPMGRWEYLMDAATGEVVYKANRIMDANDIGTGTGVMGTARKHIDTDYNSSTYRMIDYTRRLNNDPHGHDGQMPDGSYLQTNIAGSSLPGSVATDVDNVWNDPNVQSPAVDGHVYTALMYDWLLHFFGRNSYNGSGASMNTSVNYSAEGDNNAYWNGSRIVVWSWSSGWRSLAGCPDVIAHEWGHAVTDYGSNLVYEKEPGALNESFSDMMGAAFEFAHDSMDTPDWLMGENGQISGDGFRDMSDPHQFGDPDFYGTSDPYWIDVVGCSPSWLNDYCGVHTNSGVGNKWYFLLSDGGSHHGVTVTGIGYDNAILVAYRSNMYYWTSSTDYHQAALGTISAANDLDTTGAWATQVALAWNAVGVTTPGPSVTFSYPGGVPTMLVPAESTMFEVVVSGALGGTPLSGSGELHYSLDGGSWVTESMTETSPDHYQAVLPPAGCLSRYDFFVSASEVGSGVYYDPDTTNPFSAVVATGVTSVFADDFETDKGWTVSGDASDGQWNRGVPVGGGDRGDPPTDYDGSGRCYLTDNVDDNSDVDGGTTILTSPTFDLSSGDAQVNYARWYSNNFGADPYNDVFEVYISNNNGGSWTLVETVGPTEQASGGWFEHTFWVGGFVIPTSQMRLRFDASDLSDGSVVEAAVDAVSVTIFTCSSSVPQITTVSLPDWTVDVAYSQQLEASGGTGGLTFSDKYGDLVGTGLGLSSSGLLSGTPNSLGLITFTAKVVDDALQTDEKELSFTINPALDITTDSIPDWTVGQAYDQQLQATGGTGLKTWSDKNTDLIGTGLALSSTGLLSGTPNSVGMISFTAHVSDEAGAGEDQPLSFTINDAVTIVTDSLPTATEGEPYSEQLQSAAGTGTKSWSDKNGDLAGTGLTLTADGLLSGTPIDTGTIVFTASVQDIAGSTDEKQFDLRVEPAWICGDVDNSGAVDVGDLTYLVAYLFQGGPPPPVIAAADVDSSGDLNVADVTVLVGYLFQGGAAPVCI